MSFINNILKKLFGEKSDKDIKEIMPIVEQVKSEYSKLNSLSHDQLREKTEELKKKIQDYISSDENEILELKKKAESSDINVDEKDAIYKQVDEITARIDKKLEEVLQEILPTAYAIVKDTARRFSENEEIIVKAGDHDKQMSVFSGDHVEIREDKAVYHNSWDAAGNEVIWNMVHYDTQLIGGIVLHQGKIAEMQTGEGKTLVATLPVFLNALAGKGVHVVTVNDYLARRDSEWNAPIFQFHGLTVECIDNHQPSSRNRKKAYQADIVYGTNNEFGFDYLRDNMASSPEELVQGKHHFALIDEVDSVLIDDARTPLIISGATKQKVNQEYDQLKPGVEVLYNEQKKLFNETFTEAKKLIKEGNDKEGGFYLLRAHRALPKTKALIKFLSEQGMKQLLLKTESNFLQENGKRMHEIDNDLFFVIDEKANSVELTEKGIDLISKKLNGDKAFFSLPDIGGLFAEIEKSSDTDQIKLQKKTQIQNDYTSKANRIHSIQQLLKAYSLFTKEVEYVLMDNKVKIVDESTGRIMEGRRFSDGLHQALEAKENVKIEAATQTHATVTLQNYFRKYHKLAGMTGTAETEAGEFWEIYELDVVVIPTNRPIQRKDLEDKVYKTAREKFNAIIEECVELSNAGRPVLVGTTSVEISELLSRMLKLRKIRHQVLNAKIHDKESLIVSEAGKKGTVTIATNMAGRGTDIKLSQEVKDLGGLAIIGTERHDSRRVDRQLRGRSGRQGDPGSSQFFVSLEDNLMRLFSPERIVNVMDKMGLKEGEVIQHSMITKSIERAQRKVEENNFGIRKRLLEFDDAMNKQREVIYTKRKNALFGDRLAIDLADSLFEMSMNIVEQHHGMKNFDTFNDDALRFLGLNQPFSEDEFAQGKSNDLTDQLYHKVEQQFADRKQGVINMALPVIQNVKQNDPGNPEFIPVPFTDGLKILQIPVNIDKALETEGKFMTQLLEKSITLAIIDDNWKDHLKAMDDLRTSVNNATYEQKDPLLIYKKESMVLFRNMINKVNSETVSFLTKVGIPVQQQPPQGGAPIPGNNVSSSAPVNPVYNVPSGAQKVQASDNSQLVAERPDENAPKKATAPKKQPLQSEKKINPNDPCPCGSGKKYKKCHGA